MAEVLARAGSEERTADFVSCGTDTHGADPATGNAVRVMAEIGIDISAHSSRTLADVFKEAPDLVYVMTAGQARRVREIYPGFADRIRLLDPNGDDIVDPHGGDIEGYRRTRDLIVPAVARRAAEWKG
jgi:arsenate reductase